MMPRLIDRAGGEYVLDLLNTMAYLSVVLGLFNLIPFPPLDGSKVLFAFLPDRAYARAMRLERYGMLVLIVLVILMNRLLPVSPITKASQAVYEAFFRIAEFAYALVK